MPSVFAAYRREIKDSFITLLLLNIIALKQLSYGISILPIWNFCFSTTTSKCVNITYIFTIRIKTCQSSKYNACLSFNCSCLTGNKKVENPYHLYVISTLKVVPCAAGAVYKVQACFSSIEISLNFKKSFLVDVQLIQDVYFS